MKLDKGVVREICYNLKLPQKAFLNHQFAAVLYQRILNRNENKNLSFK